MDRHSLNLENKEWQNVPPYKRKQKKSAAKDDFRNCKWSHMFCETWLKVTASSGGSATFMQHCSSRFKWPIEEEQQQQQHTHRRRTLFKKIYCLKSVSCGDISVIFVGIQTRLNEWQRTIPFTKPNRIRTGKFILKITQTIPSFLCQLESFSKNVNLSVSSVRTIDDQFTCLNIFQRKKTIFLSSRKP